MNVPFFGLAVLIVTLVLLPQAAWGGAADLRCEGAVDPAGIDVGKPRLSWILTADSPARRGVRQVAYQVLVASSADRLAKDEGDLWDSGRVASERLGTIEYGGKPLASAQRVFWKTRTWDGSTDTPAYSAPATWTMGLLRPEDWQPVKWIGATDAATDSILLRRGFDARPGLTRAVVFVSGLGHYELSINGAKVGDQLLAPGWTEYRKTVLYDTFEVTSLLKAGEANAVGIILGNGMYNIRPSPATKDRPARYVKFTNSFGPIAAIALLRLEYADGTVQTIGTDGSWSQLRSPITYSNVFGGEDFDARLVPANWDEPSFAPAGGTLAASEVNGPGGMLRGHSAAAAPIRAIQTHRPISAKELRPNVTVYDLGQNASHMPRLVVRGPAGSYVRAIPSELLGRDGFVDRQSSVQDAGGPSWWQYTLAGTGGSETHFPKFVYQGCRYLQVERFPATPGGELPTVDAIEGVVVHSSSEPIGTFETSNELFNKIHALVRWAQRSNMMSLMTDCPHREKLGWLEELHLNGPSLRYNFRLDRLYTKEMNDMADAQLAVGLVPNIAPEYFLAHTDKLTDSFRNSPEWGSAFIIAAWQQYLFTGETTLLKDYYPQMARYHAFLSGMAKGEIIEQGLGDWYDLGPKPPWGSQLTPPPFTATAIYYYDTLVMADVARLLGRPSDEVAAYRAKAEQIKLAFNKRFLDAKAGRYATGSQCTSAMPLVLGLAPEESRAALLKTLIDDIRDRGNALSAGDVGYRYVLRALADAGRSDVIFEMNNQTERPGYGMQIMRGATALTEKWDASVGSFGSHNHFMLGQINEWFFHDLAGIQPDPETPGFERIVIRPALVGDLTKVSVSYNSVRGRIVSEWTNRSGGVTLNVTIPPGTTATVYVPAADAGSVREGNGPAAKAEGVKLLRVENGAAVYAVGSGTYAFSAPAIAPGRPSNLAATPANGSVALKWTAVANADHYTITRSAAGESQETTIAERVTATTFEDAGLKNDTAYAYTIRAVNAVGPGTATSVTATPAMLVNAGFETPSIKSEQYAPAGAGWTFTPSAGPNGSGITANRSGFTEKNAAAPQGVQVAFVQGTGSIRQTIRGLVPGQTYTITFKAAQRVPYNRNGQTWRLDLDEKPIAAFDPPQSATAYADYAATFTATASSHTIAFVGTNTRGGDNTVFIDDVRVGSEKAAAK